MNPHLVFLNRDGSQAESRSVPLLSGPLAVLDRLSAFFQTVALEQEADGEDAGYYFGSFSSEHKKFTLAVSWCPDCGFLDGGVLRSGEEGERPFAYFAVAPGRRLLQELLHLSKGLAALAAENTDPDADAAPSSILALPALVQALATIRNILQIKDRPLTVCRLTGGPFPELANAGQVVDIVRMVTTVHMMQLRNWPALPDTPATPDAPPPTGFRALQF